MRFLKFKSKIIDIIYKMVDELEKKSEARIKKLNDISIYFEK